MAAVAASIVAPWFLRNIALHGNPLYPAEFRLPGGVVLPGPLSREFFKPSTLGLNLGPLAENWRHFVEAFGFAIVPLAASALIAPFLLIRRLGPARAALPALAPILCFYLFLNQPFNKPSYSYEYNMRYLLPWFSSLAILGLAAFDGLEGRAARRGASLVLLCGCVANAWGAIPKYGWAVAAVAAVGLAAVRARAMPAFGRRPAVPWPAVAAILLVALLAASRFRESLRYSSSYGIRDNASSRGWGGVNRYVHKNIKNRRIAVVGDSRFFYLYGADFSNEILFIPLKLGPMMGELGPEPETIRPLFASRPDYLVYFCPIAGRSSLRGFEFDEQAAGRFAREHGIRLTPEYSEAGSILGKIEHLGPAAPEGPPGPP